MNEHLVMAIRALEQLQQAHQHPELIAQGVRWRSGDAQRIEAAMAYLRALADEGEHDE